MDEIGRRRTGFPCPFYNKKAPTGAMVKITWTRGSAILGHRAESLLQQYPT